MILQSDLYASHRRQLIVITNNATHDMLNIQVNPRHHPIIALPRKADQTMLKSVACHSGKIVTSNVFQLQAKQWLFKGQLAEPNFTEKYGMKIHF